MTDDQKYPEGRWMGVGIGTGIGIGMLRYSCNRFSSEMKL